MSVEFWRNSLGIPVTIPVECVNNSSWLCLTISAKHKIQNSKFGAQYIPKSSKIWLISFSITEIRKTGHQPQVFTILNLWSRDMEPPLKLLEMDQVQLVPELELWLDQNILDLVQIPVPIQPVIQIIQDNSLQIRVAIHLDLIQLIQDKSTGSWILPCLIRLSKVSQPKVQCSNL